MPTKPLHIAVIGAGPAGVAAASSAASTGLNVILIDSAPRIGGTVIAAMHRSLCGLYSQAPRSAPDTLNTGAQRDVIAHMIKIDPVSVIPKPLGKTWVLEFTSDAYANALLHVASKPAVEILMRCPLTGIRVRDNRITAIEIQSRWIDARAVIDCSGSGVAMRMVGENVMHPADEHRMLGGYSIRLAGIESDAERLRLQLPYVLLNAVNAGQLPFEARFTMFHPGPGTGEGICKLAVNPDQFPGDDMPALAARIIDHLRSQISGFAHVKILETSSKPLPRDGRRLKGKATLSEEDVLSGKQIGPDAVHAWWPIERWDPATGPSYAYPPLGRHYDIPEEAMQSNLIDNLFAAGTCVSATAGAAASVRASGICLATGHAAGLAAARFVEQGSSA